MYDFDNDPDNLRGKLFIQMSGNFLCNSMPMEAVDWDYDQQIAWIEENRWEPLEDYFVEDIYDMINSSALVAWSFMQTNFSLASRVGRLAKRVKA